MKRFISILVAVMMVLTLLPLGRVFAEEDVTEQEEKVMEVLGEGGDETPGDENLGDEITPPEEGGDEKPGDGETDPNKEAKDKAITTIKDLENLSQEEKDEFIKRVNAAKEESEITTIVAEAQKKSEENKAAKEKEAEEAKKQLDAAKKSLTEKIEEAKKAMKTVKYTKATDEKKAAFDKALTDADEALKKEDATEDSLKEAENKLVDAQKALDGKEEEPKPGETPEEKLAKAKEALKEKINDAEKAKYTDAYKNATKATKNAFDNALKDAKAELESATSTEDTLKAAGILLDARKNDLDGKTTTPSVPSDNYSARVPRAIRNTIANAKAMMAHSLYGSASYSSRTNLENRLASLKSIANDFENGYYSRYWNGKYWNGYYGDEWYDYYDNGYYYRNGVPYTYSGFRAHFGYYPKYDMSDYYGRGYWNGKYRRGYYRDGWYDYYENGYYYRDGVPYTYNEFRREFGYYPDYAYGRGHWYDYYDEDWDPYYGYQGRYGYYYGSSIRDAVERTVDAINAVAISADAPLMKVSYPSSSDYDGYYDYYPWYYDPYYYDGYYYDQNSSKIRELKKLIGEAEELAASRSDAQWAPYRSELTDAANYGRKAAKGRASVKGAIEELEKAIKKAKTDGMKLYIRRGYMMGVNGTEFNPSGTLTRAEMAQIIENLLEQSGDTVAFAPKNFNDVESGRWYKKAVNLVSSHNIMKGNPDGNFYPQKPVSIEELIVIAARLGGHTPQNGNVFGIEKHYWSVHYIQTAYVKGWIGMDKFNPSAPITRGQAVQILNRSLNFGVDKEFINKYGAQMNKFSDVTMSSPYYYDIVAATNTISYSQVPKSKTRIWRAYQTSNGWSSSKYSNGTYVKPYTGW